MIVAFMFRLENDRLNDGDGNRDSRCDHSTGNDAKKETDKEAIRRVCLEGACGGTDE